MITAPVLSAGITDSFISIIILRMKINLKLICCSGFQIVQKPVQVKTIQD